MRTVRQLTQSYRTGELRVAEVAQPQSRTGGVVVESRASLISAGTERTMVNLGKMSLLGKARQRPDLVAKVLEKVQREGALATFDAVRAKLDHPVPLGYSLAGQVVAVGAGVQGVTNGDRVACAGAGYANHAEMNWVPKNLVVPVPPEVSDEEAAFVTVGAIALQGVRLVNPQLGSTVAVIGLGLIGLMTVSLLVASGCDVIGFDVDETKVKLAIERGAIAAVVADGVDAVEVVRTATRGRGADAVVITASADTNAPLVVAGDIARDRARVSVVGLMPLEIPRKAYFDKELEVVVSRSYGPGRYDPSYEERGNDYPIGYVRWTEQRNMEAVLRAIATRRLDVKSLITHRYAFENVLDAYRLVTGEIREHHLGVVLNYEPGASDRVSTVAATTSTHRPRARVGFGVLGTGAFATGVLLPALSRIDRAEFVAATSARGLSARAAVDKFGGRRVAESLDELLAIPDVDAVMIATRHADHAAHAVRALRAGKDVFLEKPAALDAEQLDELEAAVIASPGRLLVGFNRRFAPLARQLKDHFAHRRTGLVINARINAGSIPDESWIQQTSEGGGRVIGEACHFIDLMSYWTDGEPTRVSCFGISQAAPHGGHDNLAILIEFSDGSVGTLTYAAMGDPSIGKERYEVFSEGAVAVLEDWKRLHLTRGGKTKTVSTWRVDKGHEGELRAFVDACVAGAPSPIAWRSIAATTRATFAAELARRTHAAVEF